MKTVLLSPVLFEVANKYFSNTGPNLEKDIAPSLKPYTEYLHNVNVSSSFFMRPASQSEISNIIRDLDKGKALGPNSIPISILKLNNDFFSNQLSKLVNLTFETGIFPDLYKLAQVIPVFKAGNENLCENYRPISLLPIYSKIYEKVMYSRIYEFLSQNNLIYNRQFGFRANHSTNHSIISLTEEIKSALDSGQLVAGVFLDLKKAFDTINHNILIHKLQYYGFRGITSQLLLSYLSNRKQFVYIDGCKSSLEDISCGIPQGSTLGPLLFLMYINDLRFCLRNSKANHFADDTCITYSNKKQALLEKGLNEDLISVTEWFKANRLSLNVSKSKLLIFRSKRKKVDLNQISIKLSENILEPVQSVKYLGMLINDNLSWDIHTNNLSKKLGRANGIISKLRYYAPMKTMLSVYYAIFHSQILYGCSSWALTTLKNSGKRNILQKKCLKSANLEKYFSQISIYTLITSRID